MIARVTLQMFSNFNMYAFVNKSSFAEWVTYIIVSWLCAYGCVYVCVCASSYFPYHTGGAMGPLLTGVLANHKVGTPCIYRCHSGMSIIQYYICGRDVSRHQYSSSHKNFCCVALVKYQCCRVHCSEGKVSHI